MSPPLGGEGVGSQSGSPNGRSGEGLWDETRILAPIKRLTAYKERMGWEFPYVSTYNTEFPFDFELALTEEQAWQIPQIKEMVDTPPDWLVEWSHQIGAELKDGLREAPAWIAFARENGTVYHTYTVRAPDPFAPLISLTTSEGFAPKETEEGI